MWRHGWKLVVLIVIGVLAFFWLIKAPIMSAYLSKKLGVPTTFRTISMWPSQTTIRYFKIRNPYGYSPKNAFEVKKISVHYRWGALTSDPRVIDEIVLDDVTLNIDIQNLTGSNNNWSAIGASIPRNRGSSREVIIKKLILRNMTVNVTGKGAKALGVSGTQHFNQMEFNNINSKEGFPTKELVSQIFKGAGLWKYLENFLDPTQRIRETLNPFKIFGNKQPSES